ncbi:MAG: 50S ribosomal protein L22 [Bacteroidales bacterium]|nr:50S ribosomal protein L22 [Bacteroidales bacterium]
MGSRKNKRAEMVKEAKKTTYFAKLVDVPTSPRKMRLVADMVRGREVNDALAILKYSPKEASNRVYKLLLSAISNWQQKNEGQRIEDAHLFISEIFVDGGRALKRLQTAPQGRAHRVRKRSNHVTMYLNSRVLSDGKQVKESEINNE